MLVCAIHGQDRPWRIHKVGDIALITDWRPDRLLLLPKVDMKVPGETENKTHGMVGDHIRKQTSHIAQHTRVFNQFGEQEVFQAGGG